MNIKTIIFTCLLLLSKNVLSQIDSTNFLTNAFNHATIMKDALLSEDLKVLYDFLKSENENMPSFEKFKEETIYAYHDENYKYDSGLSSIILEKPLVYSYKNEVLQCVIFRKTILKNTNTVIATIMWYYSTDGKHLKYENFSSEIEDEKLQEWYPFIDLMLFDEN